MDETTGKNYKSESSKRWKQPADIIQSTVGDFGRWQCRIAILMALLKFPIAWFQLGIVFLAPPTDFWCRQPEDFRQVMTVPAWRALIRPFGNETNYPENGILTDACKMRNVELPSDTKIQPCRWGYDYDKSVIHSSIITEWNLVCGNESYVEIAQMVLMLGVLCGNILFGILADKYGRKPILIGCIFGQAVCGVFSAWCPWYSGFLALRFLLAVANGGTMITSFVMCMETVGGGRWKTIVPILYQIPFGLGNSIMAGVAFMFRDWREFQLVLSGMSGLYVVYMWFIPESPRWLLATGRRQEAARVLQAAARFNKIDLKLTKSTMAMLPKLDNAEKPRIGSLLSTRELRKRTFLLCLNWLICGITFFAFSQYLGQIGTNLYITVALGGLIVIPGTFLCVIIVKRFGRRLTICCANIFTAICFLAILALPKWSEESVGITMSSPTKDMPKMALAGLGIIGLSVSTPALYLFTGELFPTVLRNVGVGSTVMFMRIGSMVAPFIITLKHVSYYLPLGILAALAVVEALVVLPLPETRGTILPDTLSDIEMTNLQSKISSHDIANGNYIAVPRNVPFNQQE